MAPGTKLEKLFMAGKIKRLSKVARELNVGIATIVEHLSSQGIDIDASPNTKIEEDHYIVLLKEFQSDKNLGEEVSNQSFTREKRESISLKDSSKDEPETSQKEKDQDEIIIKNVPVSEEPIKAKSENEVKVNVVGKIDLDKGKKTAEEPVKEEVEKPAEKEEVKAEKPAEEEKKEEPKKEEPKQEEEKPVETIKAKSEKLSGPTVVGKIVLPDKPVKSNDKDDDKSKRRRKRIKKVNVEKQAKEDQRKAKKGGKNNRKDQKTEVSEEEIQKEIKETLARLSGGGKSKSVKNRRAKRDAVAQKTKEELEKAEQEKSVLKVTEFVTVSELANMMSVAPTNIISACMTLGIFASINQRLDAETLSIIAEEFGFTVEFVSAEVSESIVEVEDKEEDLKPRPPIVTVMGHVDHGKTSLLDYVRSANVIAGEAGGITQHIGAYNVTLEDGKTITFLDTPGHEAFTAMRARGAQVTDIAIIIVAADDNVMPQTKEAINHSQAAGVPMVFAINKIDKPDANPDKIKEELSQMNILVEDWGGKFQSQEVSAKKGTGVGDLLEKVLLEAELLELKANPDKNATGTIIESSLDKGRGYVATILVEAGTLKVGDMVLAGCFYGKIKAMENERGARVEEAGPAIPVEILGLNGAPNAGDKFHVMDDEREVKEIAQKRTQLQREQGVRSQKHLTLDEIGRRLALGDFKELNVIVKGDVDGSIEALSESLQKLSTEQIQVNIIHKAVGAITESDVLLASASDAIIVGFQVRPSAGARKLAESEQIDIRLYSIIYDAIEEIKSAMEGMLSPDVEEQILGTAEIRETFKISKVGTVAGCYVLDGKLLRNAKVRVIRDGIVIYTGDLGSLKRFKDDVKEVTHGYECGLNVEKFNDLKVGDNIEAFQEVEVARKL